MSQILLLLLLLNPSQRTDWWKGSWLKEAWLSRFNEPEPLQVESMPPLFANAQGKKAQPVRLIIRIQAFPSFLSPILPYQRSPTGDTTKLWYKKGKKKKKKNFKNPSRLGLLVERPIRSGGFFLMRRMASIGKSCREHWRISVQSWQCAVMKEAWH